MTRELTITPHLINHQAHPSPTSWVKLLIYEPTEANVVATRGKMYAVLSLSSKAEIDFTPIMQLIIETLQDRYFGQTEGGIMPTLETALDAIHKQLLLAGQQDKRLSAGFSFDILTAVSWGTVLYIGQLGSSRACLWRQDKLFDIDQGDQRVTSVYLSSGVVQAGDRFILATDALLQKFSRKQLQHHLALPESTLLQSLEQQINHDPTSMESGLLLLVDIKHVPSLKDESLRILNADTFEPIPRLSSTMQTLNTAAGATMAKSKTAAAWLWHWRLADRIPALPLLIIAVCVCLLLGSVWLKNTRSPQSTVDITPVLTQLQDTFDQAQQVSTINPDRAETLLNQMEPVLAQAMQETPDSRLTQLSQQRQQLLDKLLNIEVLSPHPLAQLNGQVSQPKLVLSDQTIVLINSQQHQLMRLASGSLQGVNTDGQLYDASAHLAATDNGLVVIQPQTATPISTSGNAGQPVIIPATTIVSSASFLQNAYALSADGQVYRLPNLAGQLSEPSTYFAAPIAADNLKDIAIDGDIYILRSQPDSSSSVEKYVNGQRSTLVLDRPSLLKDIRAIFTQPDSDHLYFLADHALLAWAKTGQYIGQFRLPDTGTWQAATVDAAHKTLYILTEGKLIEADLPQ